MYSKNEYGRECQKVRTTSDDVGGKSLSEKSMTDIDESMGEGRGESGDEKEVVKKLVKVVAIPTQNRRTQQIISL